MARPSSPEPLLPDPTVHYTGFTPRGQHRILQQSPSITEAKMDMLRKVQPPSKTNVSICPTPGYLLWLEISRLPPLLPLRPDKPYDSAVWRQLTNTPQGASPTGPMPSPSRMEDNTWQKFVLCRSSWKRERGSPRLRLLTQSRVPPMVTQGNIIPPKRNAKQRSIDGFGPSTLDSIPEAPDLPSNLHQPNKPHNISLLGNSPNRTMILQRYKELQGSVRSVVPNNSRMPTPGELPQGIVR
eukprot:XP_004920121.1 PREDICTED: uncharacterized protein ENSP00000372125 homolog [Xenopus tropicalis]